MEEVQAMICASVPSRSWTNFECVFCVWVVSSRGCIFSCWRASVKGVTWFARGLQDGSTDGLVEQQGFTNMLDFGYGAAEIEGFREDDFEDLHMSV